MPRKLNREMTPDTLESEAMFTLSMLRADPNAQDKAADAEGWRAQIDALRAAESDFRQLEADTDAARIVANQYLDGVVRKFGDELFLAANKDRKSARWTRFFSMPVSEFVDQSLRVQVQAVRSWLSASNDEVLEKYRADLDAWSQKCDAALVATDAYKVRRRDVWEGRAALAADLTRKRDALHRSLAERADAVNLGRGWADLFFRVKTAGDSGSDEPAPASGSGSP